MKLLFQFILTLIFLNGYSQTTIFNKTYNLPIGNNANGIFSIISTDTGYICIGESQLSTPQSVISFFIDSFGNPIADNQYSYTWVSCVMSPESYCILNDKIFLGFLKKDFNYNPMVRRIMLFSFNGIDTVFSHEIIEDTLNCSVTDVTFSKDSELYFSGWNVPNSNNPSDGNFWLIKTDINGHLIWKKEYGGNSAEEALQIICTKDNHIVMSGYSHSFGTNNPYDNGQWYIVKTDTSGNMIWQNNYGNPNLREYIIYGLTETADSN